MNIAQLLAKSAQAFPERPALTVGTQVVSSYAACAETASRIAGFLRGSLGLATGESVAIGMTNSPAFYEVLFGIWHAGLVAVPMNAKLHANELAYIIKNAEARAAFVSGGLASVVGPLGSRAGRLIHVIDADAPEYRSVCMADPLAPAHCDGGEPAWLFYTSGTTGRPKGATLTHRNLLLMTLSYFADIDSVHPEDCIIHAAPMSHGSGLYGLAHVAKAANNVIPESGGFEPIEIFDLWRRHQSVTMFAAPTMIVRLLGAAGSAPETEKPQVAVLRRRADVRRGYTTRARRFRSATGSGLRPGREPDDDHRALRAVHADRAHPRYLERLGSVGIARTDVEVRVVDEEGRGMSPGEVGEVVVRGDVVMAGYWRNPTATASAIRNGWLRTGDLGCFDVDGFLMLKDRSKDLIISGGANIYPREVEEALLRHPAVLETVVVGRRHPEWGEEVVAFVTIRPGHSADVAALDAHCLNHIARFKRPREYRFVEVLPKNDYGKVLKRVLREIPGGRAGNRAQRVGQSPASATAQLGGGRAHAYEFLDHLAGGQLARLDLGDDPPALDHENPLSKRRDELQILFDDDSGQAASHTHRLEHINDLIDDGGLDTFGRLVEHDEARIANETAGQRQDLLLAAAKHATWAAEERPQPRKILEHCFDPRPFLRWPRVLNEPHPQVLQHAELRKDVAPLRHVSKSREIALVRRLARHVCAAKFDRPCGWSRVRRSVS